MIRAFTPKDYCDFNDVLPWIDGDVDHSPIMLSLPKCETRQHDFNFILSPEGIRVYFQENEVDNEMRKNFSIPDPEVALLITTGLSNLFLNENSLLGLGFDYV